MVHHDESCPSDTGKQARKIAGYHARHETASSKAITASIAENIQESRREWMLWMFGRAGKRNPNNEQYQFWQQHNNPVELWDNECIQQKVDYIHNNPVVAGFVYEPQHYIYSSAIDYAGGKGLVDIILLD